MTFGDPVKALSYGRRILLVKVAVVGFRHFVRAQALAHFQRVRHGQRTFRVEFTQLGDEIDDPGQLVHIVSDFVIADFQSGQVCDVLDIRFRQGHGKIIQSGKIKQR